MIKTHQALVRKQPLCTAGGTGDGVVIRKWNINPGEVAL